MDLNGADLPRLGLSHGVADFRKLRPVCREMVEPAYQNDDPKPVPPSRALYGIGDSLMPISSQFVGTPSDR